MKKFFTVLAAAALITVFVGTSFAAVSSFTGEWHFRALGSNGTATLQNSTVMFGNATISSINATAGNFTAGNIFYADALGTSIAQNMTSEYSGQPAKGVVAPAGFYFMYQNGTNGATAANTLGKAAQYDITMVANGTTSAKTEEFIGYGHGSFIATGAVIDDGDLGIAADGGASLVTMVKAPGVSSAQRSNAVSSSPWFIVGYAQNGTFMPGADARTGYFYGNYTVSSAYGVGLNLYSGLTASYYGTNSSLIGTWAVNATAGPVPGILVSNGTNVETDGYMLANGTVDSTGQIMTSAVRYGSTAVTSGVPALLNATAFSVSLKGAATTSTMSGTWGTLVVFPNATKAIIGKVTFSGESITGGALTEAVGLRAGVTAAAAMNALTAAQTANMSMNLQEKDGDPNGVGFDCTKLSFTDNSNVFQAASKTITVYGRLLSTSSNRIFAGYALDSAGNNGVALFIGTPSSSDDDDDDFLGCVFNPAASFGLEWLLLLLAPALAVLRSRFRK
ncbi:MAG: hypothetical protein H0S85_09540 [Desulfovibrionaceae bacterium]|nr:hypothetical protein [Desulfovibrionaceae bacterium]